AAADGDAVRLGQFGCSSARLTAGRRVRTDLVASRRAGGDVISPCPDERPVRGELADAVVVRLSDVQITVSGGGDPVDRPELSGASVHRTLLAVRHRRANLECRLRLA